MNIAQGSLEECRYYIILSNDLNYMNEQIKTELTGLLEEVGRLLNAYCKGILSTSTTSTNSSNSSNSLTPFNSF
jgi:hypothetical protein